MRKIAVIGGGISGLAAAYRLSKLNPAQEDGFEITVYEARNNFGGVIETERRNGLLMEKGPESFITAKPWALELCKELGLENELLPTKEESRQSYIFFKNQFYPVPQGFYLMAPTRLWDLVRTPLLSFKGKIRAALEWFLPPGKAEGDESLGRFIERRFGSEILERLAKPLISGIYSMDLHQLSLEATFPHFRMMERDYGSVIRGLVKRKDNALSSASGARYSLFLTLRGGMGQLTAALLKQMPQVVFRTGHLVKALERNGAGWNLKFENGIVAQADAVCVSVPTPCAWKILEFSAPILSAKLKEIPYRTVATVHLAYRRTDIKRRLKGAGYVTSDGEPNNIIGCTFVCQKFRGRSENSDVVLMRAFVGGRQLTEIKNANDETSLGIRVSLELARQLQIQGEPLSISVTRWPESMPVYSVGHKEKVEAIYEALKKYPGLYVTGNAYEGMGIPDCIHRAFKIADQMTGDFKMAQHLKRCAVNV